MKTCLPRQFLEQVRLNAEVVPLDDPRWLAVKVGRYFYHCRGDGFAPEEVDHLRRLYRAGVIRFSHPGDFTVMPLCLGGDPRTVQGRPVETSWHNSLSRFLLDQCVRSYSPRFGG